ncbi:suppressor of fused domain protein [Sphingobacterium kitahiroshimense]|uniref:Suppressor of fused domain protein n=1 Tax=Sphingobacterium kitahiroshimense TaxID=470446 RepID=A0ABV0C2C4_9SPHI
MINVYIDKLKRHYEQYFGISGIVHKIDKGPINKLDPEFFILEFPPNQIHNMYTYCTVGMSLNRWDENLIELFIYAAEKNSLLVDLLCYCANYHRNDAPLNLHHTVNLGQPWLRESLCDHGFISFPYLEKPDFEQIDIDHKTIKCFWYIPITKAERDFKIEFGYDALETIFEEKELNYLSPERASLI